MEENSEDRAWNAPPADPPMSDYQRRILTSLRAVFPRPCSVYKVKEGLVNDAKLTWNPDFWVEKRGTKILVVKALDQDTTVENLDSRMKDAFAVMSVNYIYRDKIALSAPLGVVIISDSVKNKLQGDRYLVYVYAFQEIECRVIAEQNISELAIHRDDGD
ncbi:MAG: hypothetical protein OK455_10130 [Thaumarchaeota archaeon]|nr:hypothetical protein [Nitrososphaerota archaeon]